MGPGDFSKIKLTGKYLVGVKHTRSETLGNEIVVFYPIDDSDVNRLKIDTGSFQEAYYLNNPMK